MTFLFFPTAQEDWGFSTSQGFKEKVWPRFVKKHVQLVVLWGKWMNQSGTSQHWTHTSLGGVVMRGIFYLNKTILVCYHEDVCNLFHKISLRRLTNSSLDNLLISHSSSIFCYVYNQWQYTKGDNAVPYNL